MVGMFIAVQDSCTTNNLRLPSEVLQQPMVQATFLGEEYAEQRWRKRSGAIPLGGLSKSVRQNHLRIVFNAPVMCVRPPQRGFYA